ncbi:MAG: shikimate kinase [Prolixibacteraceae bacterium]|jgi:shikimate kinase|nr:shikimate kinase [Prolixibacteraceae bacterium]NLO02243.1 shikimate kinase [Bacteroidales bacterium]
MRIYLIGFMGCGKSTLGKKLARSAGLQFIDMDDYIEERNCKTVPQIFAEDGETEFRIKERKALEELSRFSDVVIATGGGAPCFFDNIDLMNRTGKTIYLDTDPEILASRLMKSKIDRPLIKGKSRQELIDYINNTLAERNKFYRKAEFRISRPDTGMDEIMDMIA